MEKEIHTPGEKHIPGTLLKELKGYDSAHDPVFPATPLSNLVVGKELGSIVLYRESRDADIGKPVISGALPDFIEMNTEPTDNGWIISFHIPLREIRSIMVKSGEAPGGGYELPGRYEYNVELHTGEVFRVEGIFEESLDAKDGMPEYWYYRYRVELIGGK